MSLVSRQVPSGELASVQEQLRDVSSQPKSSDNSFLVLSARLMCCCCCSSLCFWVQALEKNHNWLVYDQQREAYVQGVLARTKELETQLNEANQALQQQLKEASSDGKYSLKTLKVAWIKYHHSLSLLAPQASLGRRLSVSWRPNGPGSAGSRQNLRIWEGGMRRRAGKQLRPESSFWRRGKETGRLCRRRGGVHQSELLDCRVSWRMRGRGWLNYWCRYVCRFFCTIN